MGVKEKIKSLPVSNGVYIFRDKAGKYLYIGKAENIRKRIKSHLENPHPSAKESILARNTASIDYIITPSEVEALILECNLIKEHKPRYNIMLRDDKKYPYIKIALQEEFPTIYLTRDLTDNPAYPDQREANGKAKYFGPYTNAKTVRKTLSFLRRIFPFKICKKKKIDGRPCLDYHIARCIGPCTGKIKQEDYIEIINGVSMFLEGKIGNLLSYLKKKMDRASEVREYEKAVRLRDQLEAVKKIFSPQIVSKLKSINQDFIGYARDRNKSLVTLFKVRSGKLLAQENFNLIVEGSSEVSEAISSFIEQYYSSSSLLPDEIFVPVSIKEKKLLEKWLKKTKGKPVKIFIPKRGSKKRMLQMASDNARYKLMEDLASRSKHFNLLIDLKKRLNLSSIPFRVEGIDISNIRGKDAVGSIVVFEKEHPKKDKWRKFRIKSVSNINDYAMMREVIARRYRRMFDEKTQLPDLVLVDGGKGQVNIARQVFNELGIKNIPVIGLAKGENKIHLSFSYKTFRLNPHIESFRFLARVRDEAHRFAHSYYENLKKREVKKSFGSDIPTIGSKIEKRIIQHFGSWEKVKKASLKELVKVKGIGKQKAKTILEFFKK